MENFKFNFSFCGDALNSPETPPGISDNMKNLPKTEITWLKSEEILVTSQLETVESVQRAHMFTCGDLEIGHIIASEALKTLNNTDNVTKAEGQHSDLVTGKYEGGLKIWECTSDLIEYLLENVEKDKWNKAEVLDLGCGAGLLGIMTLLNGASVIFQDYNKEVVETVTIPNVLLNIEEEERESLLAKCRFFSGDWASFDESLESSKQFDFILTSETIYNCENYAKLIQIFSTRLKRGGKIFVAAKTYYFGVGGGTRQFETAVQNGGLKCNVCWKSSGGIQREVLQITQC